MQKFLEYLVETTTNGVSRDRVVDCLERYESAKEGMYAGFYNIENEKRLYTRVGFGSKIGLVISMWNLYQIRQVVLKQAINLTKSKDKNVIRAATLGMACVYGFGLVMIWQLPFVTFEFANDLRRGSALAVAGYNFPPSFIQPRVYDLIKGDIDSKGF